MPTNETRSLHVGFVSPAPVLTEETLSGMPWRMLEELRGRFDRVTVLCGKEGTPLGKRALRVVPAAMVPFTKGSRSWARGVARRCAEVVGDSMPGYREGRMVRRAGRASAALGRAAEAAGVDVLVGCCISSQLYGLRTRVPVVYFSDATARLITGTYPRAARRGASYKRGCDTLERGALAGCARAVFASAAAARSAVEDYGVEASRVLVVPMGAHVVPDGDVVPRAVARGVARLCIVASDPERKRLDIAIGAAEELVRRGWCVTLTHIGPMTALARRSGVLVCTGRLRLSNAPERAVHERVLGESHLMLLPSAGEAFGIAPCEAAHFACPSIVSDAGGLATVVEDGVTGVVLPVAAGAREYADAVERVLGDPEGYARMARAARRRAAEVLSWQRWGDAMAEIIRDAAGGRKAEVVVRHGVPVPRPAGMRYAGAHGNAPVDSAGGGDVGGGTARAGTGGRAD
jgi:glycosyltransferase involved in cell wall biosynthesis